MVILQRKQKTPLLTPEQMRDGGKIRYRNITSFVFSGSSCKSHFFWRYVIKEQAINQEIAGIQVRLVGAQGEQLGIVSAEEANRLAEQAGVDLVMVAPSANHRFVK